MDAPALTVRARAAATSATLIVALLFAGRIWLIPARFSTDPNEGWNAVQAIRALGAGPLYPPPGGLTGNNYPPLSFYLIGCLGRLTGDAIVAGRMVAFAAVLAVAGWIALLARRLGGGGRAATALLFLGLGATLLRPYLALDDPQWLAHALMTGGLWLVVPVRGGEAPTIRRTMAAALAVVAGGLVKHNLVALPLAVTLWLTWRHPRAAIAWIGTGLIALALAAACCGRAYGRAFFVDLLAADRHYSWARMWGQGWVLLAVAAPMLAASLPPLLRIRAADRRIDLLLLLLATSLPLGLIQQSGQGVDVNADMEAVIALCLAGGVALARGDTALRLALLSAPLAWLLPQALRDERDEIANRATTQVGWDAIEARIARTPGAVACAMPAFCYWTGRDMGIDAFLYGQHMAVRHDAAALERALARRRFSLIELEPPDPPVAGELPDPLAPLVARRYHVVFGGPDGRQLFAPN